MTTSTDARPTTLRERMIEDMKLHRLSRATQHNYLRDVTRFANWLGRPPDRATDEDLRRYQIEQSEHGLGAPAMNMAVSALRFLYTRTLDRRDLTRKLHRVKHPRALPTVLSRDEVARMLEATTSLKHQAILSVAYGAGLRASEVTRLKIRDVDSERMLLRVECGKGGRHRNAMLAADLLTLLGPALERHDGLPCELAVLLTTIAAAAPEAYGVMLDCDGPVVTGLATFDW